MKKIFLALVIFLCCAQTAWGASKQPNLDYSSFALLPVLHDGRIKPLDSYARLKLYEYAETDFIEGKPPIAWLAQSLFDPAAASELPLFKINNSFLKDHLELDRKKKRFALIELVPALQKRTDEIAKLLQADEKDRTEDQQALLILHGNVKNYSELLRSFSAIMPLNIEIPDEYIINNTENTYLNFMNLTETVQKRTRALVRKKGINPERYNDAEKKLANFAFALEDIRAGGEKNNEFKVMYDSGQWYSPWQLLGAGKTGSGWWEKMAYSFRGNHPNQWLEATQKAHPPGSPDLRLKLENIYNKLKPFKFAFGLYILGIIFLAAEIYRKTFRPLFPLLCLNFGIATQVFGILLRIYILERPPVGTLYESLLFVSLICALTALIFYLRRKNFVILFAGMGSASLLLCIAPFMLQKNDGLEVLAAVLNTNFWLGTHVLCITAGYAVSIITAFMAHAWLALRVRNTNLGKLMQLQTAIYHASAIALLFTAIGTILGGIWADQSWGRFWGWDPKENGALLIVLWIIWMQHGRVAGKLSTLTFTVAAAFLNVIVALAWFGVNLLNVGLHSYGFITGIAWALTLFCVIEISIIAALWRLNVRKNSVPLA